MISSGNQFPPQANSQSALGKKKFSVPLTIKRTMRIPNPLIFQLIKQRVAEKDHN
jgi:hypothetical protein